MAFEVGLSSGGGRIRSHSGANHRTSVRRLTPWSSATSDNERLPVSHRVSSVRWWRSLVSGRFRTVLDTHDLQYQRCVPAAVRPRFCMGNAQTEQSFFHEIRLPPCLIL